MIAVTLKHEVTSRPQYNVVLQEIIHPCGIDHVMACIMSILTHLLGLP